MVCNLEKFQDILEPRRKNLSNFMWVSRELKATVPYKHSVKTSPQQLKFEVLKSARIQEIIRKVSEEQKLPAEVLEEEVKNVLNEIGYNRKLKVIRWLGLVLANIFTRVCTGIHVHEESILQLKSQMGQVPVIYLPSHRTYADFILMSYICFHYDIEIPAIAAGMDFHGMMGMGNVLRDTGAFFMRRSYNDDSLYWDTFREYVYHLVTKADLGVEFFIEGTRSRSGKSLTPKFGLLTMVLKAFFNGEIPDVLFVPINISYDRVMEERLFAFELLGVPKPKESTSAFFKSLKLVNDRYGDVYVNFGSPISAHKFFDDRIDRSVHNMRPKHVQVITEPERRVISTLAQEIVNRQQKLCVITTFNMISVVLTSNLVRNKPSLTLDALIEEVVWIKSVFEATGALTNLLNEREDVTNALVVHHNLIRISEGREVCLVQNNIVLDRFDDSRLKGHSFTEKTMSVVIPFIMLQIYVNPTLHCFVSSALLVIILKKHVNLKIVDDILFEEYCFLRSLFSKEFVLFSSREKMDFADSLEHLQNLNVIERHGGRITLDKNEKLQRLLCDLMAPFFLTYHVVCSVLKEVAITECAETKILLTTQSQIEALLNTSTSFIHPYSLNLDSITNCLLSFVELTIVCKIRKCNSVFYQVNVEPYLTVEAKLQEYMKQMVSKQLADKLDGAVRFGCKL